MPPEWKPQVDRWLKRMGYRFVLRKFTYPARVPPGGRLGFDKWWENKGVAPCYRQFPVAVRLKGQQAAVVLATGADIREWLPGDIVYDSGVVVPFGTPAGDYELQLAVIDPQTRQPKVRLAIEGGGEDGWYTLGKLRVE